MNEPILIPVAVAIGAVATAIVLHRRSMRRSRAEAARVVAELELVMGEPAQGTRHGAPVALWWSRRASGARGAAPVTICASPRTWPHAAGLVVSSPRAVSMTTEIEPGSHVATRTPIAIRLGPRIAPLVVATAVQIEGVYNVEIDAGGVQILLREHVFDRAALTRALDHAVVLAREVEQILAE